MMLWHIFIRRGIAYIPTMAQTEAGFYLAIEPVEVVPVSDVAELQAALGRAMARGNPRVATPTRAAFPKPVVLKYAKVKSQSAFEKNTDSWTITFDDGIFEIKGSRLRSDSGWEDDPAKVFPLSSEASAEQIIDIILRG